jgi:hypothetical protein
MGKQAGKYEAGCKLRRIEVIDNCGISQYREFSEWRTPDE